MTKSEEEILQRETWAFAMERFNKFFKKFYQQGNFKNEKSKLDPKKKNGKKG